MSEFEVAYHKRWRDMLEPIEGVVVSVPVLVEAECMEKREAELSRQLANDAEALTRHVGKTAAGHPRREIVSLDDFLSRVLGLTPDLFARGDELPAAARADEHLQRGGRGAGGGTGISGAYSRAGRGGR